MKWKVTTPLVIYSGLSTTQPADAKVPLSEADMLVNPGVGSVVGGATSPPVPLPEDQLRISISPIETRFEVVVGSNVIYVLPVVVTLIS